MAVYNGAHSRRPHIGMCAHLPWPHTSLVRLKSLSLTRSAGRDLQPGLEAVKTGRAFMGAPPSRQRSTRRAHSGAAHLHVPPVRPLGAVASRRISLARAGPRSPRLSGRVTGSAQDLRAREPTSDGDRRVAGRPAKPGSPGGHGDLGSR